MAYISYTGTATVAISQARIRNTRLYIIGMLWCWYIYHLQHKWLYYSEAEQRLNKKKLSWRSVT